MVKQGRRSGARLTGRRALEFVATRSGVNSEVLAARHRRAGTADSTVEELYLARQADARPGQRERRLTACATSDFARWRPARDALAGHAGRRCRDARPRAGRRLLPAQGSSVACAAPAPGGASTGRRCPPLNPVDPIATVLVRRRAAQLTRSRCALRSAAGDIADAPHGALASTRSRPRKHAAAVAIAASFRRARAQASAGSRAASTRWRCALSPSDRRHAGPPQRGREHVGARCVGVLPAAGGLNAAAMLAAADARLTCFCILSRSWTPPIRVPHARGAGGGRGSSSPLSPFEAARDVADVLLPIAPVHRDGRDLRQLPKARAGFSGVGAGRSARRARRGKCCASLGAHAWPCRTSTSTTSRTCAPASAARGRHGDVRAAPGECARRCRRLPVERLHGPRAHRRRADLFHRRARAARAVAADASATHGRRASRCIARTRWQSSLAPVEAQGARTARRRGEAVLVARTGRHARAGLRARRRGPRVDRRAGRDVRRRAVKPEPGNRLTMFDSLLDAVAPFGPTGLAGVDAGQDRRHRLPLIPGRRLPDAVRSAR